MHAKQKIYLAGPITGLDYKEARLGWRKDFSDLLKARDAIHLECYSPMREKEFLEKEQCISGVADYESLHGFGTPWGILTRDHNDVRTCDAMVACFLGAKKVSIGTCVEVGFAHAYRKPLILVMEPEAIATESVENQYETVDFLAAMHGRGAIMDELRKRGYLDGTEFVIQGEEPATRDTRVFIPHGVKAIPGVVKNPHDHVFLRACAGYVVPTLEHAADICISLLTPSL